MEGPHVFEVGQSKEDVFYMSCLCSFTSLFAYPLLTLSTPSLAATSICAFLYCKILSNLTKYSSCLSCLPAFTSTPPPHPYLSISPCFTGRFSPMCMLSLSGFKFSTFYTLTVTVSLGFLNSTTSWVAYDCRVSSTVPFTYSFMFPSPAILPM